MNTQEFKSICADNDSRNLVVCHRRSKREYIVPLDIVEVQEGCHGDGYVYGDTKIRGRYITRWFNLKNVNYVKPY